MLKHGANDHCAPGASFHEFLAVVCPRFEAQGPNSRPSIRVRVKSVLLLLASLLLHHPTCSLLNVRDVDWIEEPAKKGGDDQQCGVYKIEGDSIRMIGQIESVEHSTGIRLGYCDHPE